jgi:hypothetical protein
MYLLSTIKLEKGYSLVITAFSPNGDGINDSFSPVSLINEMTCMFMIHG